MTAAGIAAALGGAHRSGAWWRCRCPVHASQSATLALRDGERALIAKCWAGCDARDVLAELRRRGLVGGGDAYEHQPDPEQIRRRREAEAADRRKRTALARDMVADSLPAGGTVVERYLREARGVLGTGPVPPTIRYLPVASPYAWHTPSGGRRPVMLAAVEHVEHGMVGVHRTWLALDGSAKASFDPVRMSTGPIRGSAVRLAPAAETLLIAEGAETTLAGMIATGLPGWAALSTAGMMALSLPPIVRQVIILADNDRSGAGERAAYAAADRWLAEGRRVRIAMPPVIGVDWADVLTGRDEEMHRAVA